MIRDLMKSAAVALVLLPGLARAETPACYTLDQTGQGAQALDDLVITGGGDVSFTYAGYPQIPYEDRCDIEGKDFGACPLDCDGGMITLIRLPEGLLASFSRRIENVRFDSVTTAVGPMDATGQSLVGTYLLRPAPVQICREIAARKPDLSLYAGLHFPGVARLEAGLAKAGYFNGVPDWSFTLETQAALRAAQEDLGYPASGTADRAFLRALANYAAYTHGGC